MFVVHGQSGEGGGAGIGPLKMGRLVVCRDSRQGNTVLRAGTFSSPVCLSILVWRSDRPGALKEGPKEGVVLPSTEPGFWLVTCGRPC